jgi:hypothetical protein
MVAGGTACGVVCCGFRAAERGSGGVLWTCSIFALFSEKRVRGDVLMPTRGGNGHELGPDNLALAERGTRWRCRQCGAERAAAWRRKRGGSALGAHVASGCHRQPTERWRERRTGRGKQYPAAATGPAAVGLTPANLAIVDRATVGAAVSVVLSAR